MEPMELATKIAELNAWIQANTPKKREELTGRQEQILRNLIVEFQEQMFLVLPPGAPCTHCKGTGLDGDA